MEMKQGTVRLCDSMAEKDITEKALESYNDVFADIANVLLFEGKEIISSEELEERQSRTYYKAAGEIREIERDVSKIWKKGKIRLSLIGYENQTEADPDMPLRIMGYDGAEYRAQLTKENKSDNRYPVITLVLYFGYTKHWDKTKSLLERLEVPYALLPYVNDYKINLFEIAYLTREQVNLFQSDFRVVADYFVQKREKGSYTPEALELKHIQETLQLLSVMTGDHRFEELYNEKSKEGRPHNMCEILDQIENRGLQNGIKQGKTEKELQIIQNMYRHQFPLEQIAVSVERSVEEIKDFLKQQNTLPS